MRKSKTQPVVLKQKLSLLSTSNQAPAALAISTTTQEGIQGAEWSILVPPLDVLDTIFG